MQSYFAMNTKLTFHMEQNELTRSDGIIGAFQSDSDPIEFLTTKYVTRETWPSIPDPDGNEYPGFYIELKMTNIKHIHKREAYSFFDLLGDFGGFYDALFLLIGSLSTFYSAKAY